MNDEELRKLNAELNQKMAPLFAQLNLGMRSTSYQYYSRKDSKDRYFYTTEKTKHKGKLRYVAGIYRHLKTKNQLKLVKRAGFAKRYKADAWALAMCDKEEKAKATPSTEVAR